MHIQKQIVDSLDVIHSQIERNKQSINSYDDIKKTIVWTNIIGCEKVKKLADILIKKTGKSLSRDNMIDGEYPVIGGGKAYSGFHNNFNYDEKLLFIARVGSAGYVSEYTSKCYVTDLVGAFSTKENIRPKNAK